MQFDHKSGDRILHESASLYYETAGAAGGYPLILLHGGLGSLMDFNPLLSRLSPAFRFIGIDLRGHGMSTLGDQPLSYAQYARDVLAVLSHLGVNHFALLGFSDGGIAGYHLALKADSGLRKLITLGASCRLPQGEARAMLGSLTVDAWTEMFPQSVQHYQSHNPAPDLEALLKAVTALWLDEGGYPREAIGGIAVPTLILRGDTDPLFSLEEACEAKCLIKGAAFGNIPFAGHDAHENEPDLFAAMVNRFLMAG